jgi:transcriptional regulator with XRE-family HTH domain
MLLSCGNIGWNRIYLAREAFINTDSAYPTEIVARRVREARNRRGWTQAELADRLTELGHPTNQPTVARLESGKRAVPIEELFALAAALEVPPVHLLTPLDDDAQVAVTPNTSVPAPLARAWLRGQAALPGAGTDWTQVPESELRRLIRRELTRGVTSGIQLELMRDRLDEEVERIAGEIRNPKEEENG